MMSSLTPLLLQAPDPSGADQQLPLAGELCPLLAVGSSLHLAGECPSGELATPWTSWLLMGVTWAHSWHLRRSLWQGSRSAAVAVWAGKQL